MKKPLVVLVGPTASGKTEVAEQLARRYPLEIISADSRQVYKFMDIGTGKSASGGKEACHLIDIVKPDEDFTVADYKKRADRIIKEIYRKKRIPFLVGGSGLYIRAVIDGLCPAPSANWQIRKKLDSEANQYGNIYIYNRLKEIDPVIAGRIHPNDRRRIIRALEVYEQTGNPFSYYQAKTTIPSYDLFIIGIRYPMNELYKKINKRVDLMIKIGLIKEVEGLLAAGYGPPLLAVASKTGGKSMESLGYKEIIGYLMGKYQLEEAIRLLKRNTRRYARRQVIWFKKDKRIKWIDVKGGNISAVIEEAGKVLDNFKK
ncbi:tRNA (adenosine(37)-N6)-dimethylallyltransferase MiaA [Candidatus Desantisbacteria bacterium CG1_02_38_46]|uniref:tRNA dimethylallyltransferase n=1 Tax=Candidatus Desantisbacteria bacterium CG1_02_38_46 TaxID=1817893 RepID=A0A1J4S8D2_9BACT|nr:MAG: tRNA (adenosine(37)-N6)-dimethylallyltransferase MiaA [Candidatus Desantisbacteria bacterium CG1_02_38_46]